MQSGTETTGSGDLPGQLYAAELAKLEAVQVRSQRRGRLLGIAKLAVAAGTLIAGALLIHDKVRLAWLLIPCAVFLALAVWHEKLLAAIRLRERAARFYRRGLERLEGRWAGERGERFMDAAHPYARDLDVFGEHSLFEYLNTGRTRAGETRLAQWLQAAAPVDEVLARQAAVKEIGPRVKLRERLASCGEDVRAGVDGENLAAWGERGALFTSTETLVATTGLALLWLTSLAAWPLYGTWFPLLVMSVANIAYSHRIFLRLEQAAGTIEKAAAELRLLAEVLVLLEQEEFASARLKDLGARMRGNGAAPSRAIRRLARLAETIESRENRLAKWLDTVLFWSAQIVFMAERWQRRHGARIREWLDAAGEFEALASLGAFAFEHPEYAFAELVEDGPLFEAEGLGHPLLPPGKSVNNDVRLDRAQQLMILSGPNMAGKSTFIRCIGVNAVLAQCGAPVRAKRLVLSPLQVAASICILDSLSGGVSRFYAEIQRVKAIVDLAQSGPPVLFLLDELLSGTNSHDRLVGTRFVLETLVQRRAIGVVSTHDLALAAIPESMSGRAFNAHFADHVEGDALVFDYRIRPGVVQTSNALKLMRAIGIGVDDDRLGDDYGSHQSN
jgi:hypothetical protein